MTTDWDAIVIGAGPAGSVVARQLALGGQRVLLLDRKRFPRRKVCGACLNHSSVTLLEELGLGDLLRESCGPELHRFDLRAGSRCLTLPLPTGRAISRAVLDQQLVAAARRAGVTFQDGVTATVGETRTDGRTVEWKSMTDGRVGPAVLRRAGPTDSAVTFSGVNCEGGPALQAIWSHPTTTNAVQQTATSKVVLAADGLGHPSLCDVSEIRERVVARSRIGAGCEVAEFPAEFVPGVIHMAVGRGGYVGLVRVESGALNIAAAFYARLVRDAGGPALAAASVLAQSGFPAIQAMAEAD